MAIELYDHQLEAIEKLQTGSILCGGVGSGKSRTAIAYYFLKVCNGKIKINGTGGYMPMANPLDLYIITTARKRDTLEWEEELAPFLLSSQKEFTPSNAKVVVDSWNNIKKYVEVKNAFFIFDEQRVVGSGTWVKSFLKITQNNKWILLTATPGDSWVDYIPVFVANGFYKNRTQFKRRHVLETYYGNYPKIQGYREEGRLQRLRNKILIKMDFDKPTTPHHEYLLTEYDRTLYKEFIKERWNIYEDKPVENASELCYLLRRVPNADPSRLDLLESLLDAHHKIIVFYNFDYELELLKGATYSTNPKIAEWNGHKHEPIPESDYWLYLVQYAAGAEGWNCVETDTIVFYSQSYSYKTMTQAAGRIDRLNTPFRDLYYYHFRSSAPIDIAILRALRKKKDFNVRSFALSNRF